MSQDSGLKLSQGSLAPPVEISGPATPIKRASLSASPDFSAKAGSQTSQSEKNKLFSPRPLSSSDMTPPPSSQIPGAPMRQSRSRSNSLLPSPPDLEKTLCVAYGASENLPTAEDIDTANNSQLRTIAKDLLGVAQEARMSALHFKLQNSLLSFTSNEAIKRAEVEHQLARREVEILQSSEYRSRQQPSEIKPLQQISNAELELALKRNQELERVNATLDRRLRRAKKLIEQEKERSESLQEENGRLKNRIRENRNHFSLMIEHSSMSPSPQMDFHRQPVPHFGESHDPFAALLAADEVLNRESASVTSTPNRHHIPKQQHNGHVRGTHSLSSLPMTPARSQAAYHNSQYLNPAAHSRDERHDRDSTISASDPEEAETEEDVPGSQASSLATNMLRRNPMVSHHGARGPTTVPKSSTLLQTKLFGQVKKAGVEPPNQHKRKGSFEEESAASKKSKADSVGLGIAAPAWSSNTGRA
ncbi:hypothetical protein ASPWEDRAFT_43225 [Aspergillus wentii DTO 134E9]|uniref:Uncharacterized protein n=1 Tax=Aspergillus wentii DTO 134E9 TaxID=1073089 RepID=A0A1L9RE60_ASPWE|nr:uncharacterized protein ASPWEDRAFT_43225 [Aspergillus wentii DTO 134E9]OJJ33153.1 hypothetical protein ASPWEDRAFT_43225 [Aspergillus wentii DTO 134E9]